MDVDTALRQFAGSQDVPRAAIRWTLDHWDRAAPSLVSRLALARERPGTAGSEAFYILHLCGERGERAAYAPLCAMIARDPGIGDWLGDAVTETLPGILINVFDGDVRMLQDAIESPAGDEFARASALAALGYLVRDRSAMTDSEMADYLRRVRRSTKPRGESVIWMTWASTAANLGYDDLRSEVATLNSDHFLSELEFGVKDFDRQIALVRNDPAGLAGFEADLVQPLANAISALEMLSHVGHVGGALHEAGLGWVAADAAPGRGLRTAEKPKSGRMTPGRESPAVR
jgi:Protein of unknown function (DUF1186)